MEKVCSTCGNQFSSKEKRRKFCSLVCAYGHRKGDTWTAKQIDFLKQNFRMKSLDLSRLIGKSLPAVEAKKGKLRLRWAQHKTLYICKFCGKKFEAYRASSGDRVYCSHECWCKDRDRTQSYGFCQPKHPDLSPTCQLAYILGVLKGDGWCYKFHNKKKTDAVIGLGVNDCEFAESFAKALRLIGLNPKVFPLDKYKGSTTKWRATCSSREFVTWYKSLRLSEIFQMLDNREDLALQFFRGFYESEGCLSCSPAKSYYCVVIANTDKPLLENIQRIMQELGYDFRLSAGKKPKPQVLNDKLANFRKPVYRLVLHKKAQVKELLLKIQPSIPRKQWAETRENDR